MATQKVLITGGTSGLGEALFYRYITEGYDVIACGRNQNKLEQLQQVASKDSNNQFLTLNFDITDEKAVAEKSSSIDAIDVLILNAGDCQYIDDVMKFDHNAFVSVVSTNLLSVSALLKHFLPKVKRGGQIVLVSSSVTIMPFTRAQAYGASKAGLDYLAKSLRLDLIPHQIGVTLIHPGFIKTPLTDKNDFAMPFMLSAYDAAFRVFEGVEKRKRYLHFPKRLTLLLKIFSFLPDIIWQKIMLRGMTK